jgi:hypothetical protein
MLCVGIKECHLARIRHAHTSPPIPRHLTPYRSISKAAEAPWGHAARPRKLGPRPEPEFRPLTGRGTAQHHAIPFDTFSPRGQGRG